VLAKRGLHKDEKPFVASQHIQCASEHPYRQMAKTALSL